MYSNLWNLRAVRKDSASSKKSKPKTPSPQRLHRKIQTRNSPTHPIQHRCFSPLSITQRQLQTQNNHNLGRKLITISNMPHSPRGLKLSRNLQLNSSVNRMSKMREI